MGDVAFKRDIDYKLSKKLGMDLDMVRENTDFLFKRLKVLMASSDIDSIFLTGLGTLYIKDTMVKAKIYDAEKYDREVNQKWLDIMERHNNAVIKHYSERNRIRKRPRIYNYFFKRGKTFEQLQEFQNEQD